MVNEKKNKPKIVLKGTSNNITKLILKKENILQNSEVLLLNKEINKNKKIKIISDNKIFDIQNKNYLSEKILEVNNISKKIQGRPILQNVSLHLKHGEILGLLGPNGAGKSTLFNLIIGKTFPDIGEIKLNNKVITDIPTYKRALKGISLLEQHRGLFGNMTAYENLYSILELHMKDKNKIDSKIEYLLGFFGLQYLSNIKANNLSGGEYKKISTLQRICNKNIRVLLLDEPMAALDPLSIISIKKFILELKSIGLSIIITDHNFYAIQDILSRCVIIRDGQVMIEGNTKDIVKNKQVIKYYLGSELGF